MSSRILLRVGLAVLVGAGVLGCSKPQESTEAPTGAKRSEEAQPRRKLAFVTNNASDFWTIARAGCDKATEELDNVEVDFRIPQDGQAMTQRQQIDDLLARGVDGIAVSPIDPANQTEYLNGVAKKTLLVCHDSDAPKSERAFYVGTDNVAAGRQAGDLIKEVLPDGGRIMLFVGSKDAQNAKERIQGIREAIKGSKVTVVDVRTDDTDRQRAIDNVKNALTKDPALKCVVGLWSYNGPAIIKAVEEMEQADAKIKEVKIVTFDEEDDTLAGVQKGRIYATVVQQPYEFSYQSIKLMQKYLADDKADIPENKLVIVPTKVINKENVDEFWTTLKKLRGK